MRLLDRRLYILLVCIVFSGCITAQNQFFSSDTAQTIGVSSKFGDMSSVMHDYLWLWQNQYFNIFFEYPEDANKSFDFKEDDKIQYLPSDWKEYMRNHKSDYSFYKTDSTLDIFYRDSLFARYSTDIRCLDFTIDDYRNYCVRGIYEDGSVLCTDSLTEEYKKQLKRIMISLHKKHNYKVIYLPSIETIKNRPPYVLYEYNKSSGLTIHKICQCEYSTYKNLYTFQLEKWAKNFCKKYGFSKLLFTSIIMADE